MRTLDCSTQERLLICAELSSRSAESERTMVEVSMVSSDPEVRSCSERRYPIGSFHYIILQRAITPAKRMRREAALAATVSEIVHKHSK